MTKTEFAHAMTRMAELLNVPEGNLDACAAVCNLRIVPAEPVAWQGIRRNKSVSAWLQHYKPDASEKEYFRELFADPTEP